MPTDQKAVAVFCASSRHCPPALVEAARRMGELIGSRGWRLVYGGTDVGLMKEVADATKACGGGVTGVIPRFMVEKGIAGRSCDELMVVETMRARKARMEELADAFIILPGGIGTLEEFFEILTLKQLALHAKPVVLLDVAGFWQPMLGMLESMIEFGVMREGLHDLYHVAQTPADVIAVLDGYRTPDISSKWA